MIIVNDYHIPAPRAALGITAFALSALTLGLSVVVPAEMNANALTASALSAGRSGAVGPIDVIINPTRIDVIGVREPKVS